MHFPAWRGHSFMQVRNPYSYTLRYHPDERASLFAFFNWLEIVDPDLIIGWSIVNFDLNFLDRKCRSLGIPFAMGRGKEPAAITFTLILAMIFGLCCK
ncbi:MAG: hypothetical protein N2C13_00135 [Chloroflexota bacterium]